MLVPINNISRCRLLFAVMALVLAGGASVLGTAGCDSDGVSVCLDCTTVGPCDTVSICMDAGMGADADQ